MAAPAWPAPGLQLVEDERLHLLLSDLARLDVGPDLLWREARVTGPEGDIHYPDRIGRMGQELDINRGFHPGPSHFETPTYWCQGQRFPQPVDNLGRRYHDQSASYGSGFQPPGARRQLPRTAVPAADRARRHGSGTARQPEPREAGRPRAADLPGSPATLDARLEE